MVTLGFIKNADQCPPEFPRVFIRPKEDESIPGLTTTIYSRPDAQGVQLFELAFNVPAEMEHVEEWVPAMAKVLINMGWTTWWIDSFSVSMVLNRYITEALKQWGRVFWKHYEVPSVVLVQVGLQRESVSQSVLAWTQAFSHLRQDPEYDFDHMELDRQAQNRERKNRLKSLLWPTFLRPSNKKPR